MACWEGREGSLKFELRSEKCLWDESMVGRAWSEAAGACWERAVTESMPPLRRVMTFMGDSWERRRGLRWKRRTL
jgi:hypothetical protein